MKAESSFIVPIVGFALVTAALLGAIGVQADEPQEALAWSADVGANHLGQLAGKGVALPEFAGGHIESTKRTYDWQKADAKACVWPRPKHIRTASNSRPRDFVAADIMPHREHPRTKVVSFSK